MESSEWSRERGYSITLPLTKRMLTTTEKGEITKLSGI